MPEREVRYCTAKDGVRIAYTVTGSGPPHLLVADPPVSHVQLEWGLPLIRRIYERLANNNTLIRFDARGAGMSDRVQPPALEHHVLDIEAVVDRIGLTEFALSGIELGAPSAIMYAAKHPGRVKRIALLNGFLRMKDAFETPQIRAIFAAAASDFEMATEAIGTAVFGSGREESRPHGAYIRSCVGPDFFAQAGVSLNFDATPYASAVTMPALVIRHEGLQYVTADMTRDLVSRLPDARLVVVPGLWGDDPESLADHVAAFINEGDELPEVGVASTQTGLRTVLFTDLVGHTEMMQRLGDERGRALLREHERITRDVLKQHDGQEIKTMGDGFMASFGSVTKAVECAIALQRAFEGWNAQGEHAGSPLQVRAGLNAGEPIAEEGDLFGATVILAARIAAQAGAGEILIPEPVRHLLAGKDFLFADRGEVALKGFEDAVRLYEVRWQEGSFT